ncbi:GSCFA domain-containing protein [Pseudoalteromonas luteoviolacea]|uniref:GSCFA domain-containing protein n=1 Tax=Pseudoalteromonas luteoviolacea TaxID=43657 RepID=UPI001B3649EE|nr:GSCFA domain-containing protein [Pseudoalteromonas luteoviolacea]MBQ4836997.1 GSCFA domain-containing protein [Pseudoalteromonas luteoviolacea]
MQNLLLGNIPSHERLNLALPHYNLIDNLDKSFVTFGSCFASSVSRGLWRLGFDTYFSEEESFHYSPNSIKQYFEQLSSSAKDLEDYVVPLEDGKFKSVATRYVSEPGQSLESFCAFLKKSNQQMKQRIEKADFIVLTLGNATYQKLKTSGLTLCHGGGLPTDLYEVIKSPYEEVLSDLTSCLTQLKTLNASCQVILTVSPQRYGWLMNANLSTGINEILDLDKTAATNWLLNSNIDKAKLRLAIDSMIESNSVEHMHYFPSFEIVMDELRDYEGFNHDVKDLMHVNMPNTPNFVINKFLNSFCDEQLREVLAFFRATLDILIDIYPSRLKKMSSEQAKKYIEDKLPTISKYVDAVQCDKLAGYVLRGMMIAFPSITAETIAAHKLKNLESYLSDPMKDKITQIAALQSESICVIGNTQDLDTLCKSSALLNKNVTRILTTNQDDKLWGIPVVSVTTDIHIEEQVVLVLDDNLQRQLEEQGKLRAKVII